MDKPDASTGIRFRTFPGALRPASSNHGRRRSISHLQRRLARYGQKRIYRWETVTLMTIGRECSGKSCVFSISPGALLRFLGRFQSVSAAHHRLLRIHPFIDGNGRVARLMSHAMLLRLLDTGAIWSVARGLARKVEDYKGYLADCDSPRRNDYDGRGNLSEEALAEFTKFFLEVCIDQVQFMKSLIQPDALRERIIVWAEEEIVRGDLPRKSGNVLKALLYRGNLPRADVAVTVRSTERHARRVVAALSERGVCAYLKWRSRAVAISFSRCISFTLDAWTVSRKVDRTSVHQIRRKRSRFSNISDNWFEERSLTPSMPKVFFQRTLLEPKQMYEKS